jgi:hypothetical protein
MRHRIIHCLDALFIGMILGLLAVTLAHASPSVHRWRTPTGQWTSVCNQIRNVR